MLAGHFVATKLNTKEGYHTKRKMMILCRAELAVGFFSCCDNPLGSANSCGNNTRGFHMGAMVLIVLVTIKMFMVLCSFEVDFPG